MSEYYYSDSQPELIHCKFCGEDYAATYKYCPFCETAPNGKKMGHSSRKRRQKGKGTRVRTNTRGGGYGGERSPLAIVGIIAAIVLVIAAIILVVVLLRSVLSNVTDSGDVSAFSSSDTAEDGSASGDSSGEADVVSADSLTLDQAELTLDAGGTAQLTCTVSPENWTGTVTWSTSDGNVAVVDENGLVTYVGAGSCTITATADNASASAAVTCNEAAPAEEPITVTAYGNTMDGDFTVKIGEVIPFKAAGGDGSSYAWSVEDAGVASVDPVTGSCTGLAAGKTKMTVTSGSQSVTVTVRVVAG